MKRRFSRRGNALPLALILLGSVGLAVCFLRALPTLSERLTAAQVYDTLQREAVTVQARSPEPTTLPQTVSNRAEADVPAVTPIPEQIRLCRAQSVDFDALLAINADTIGWLCCTNTEIDYPVVYSADNAYYLSHLIDGTKNRNGTLFVDKRNSRTFSDRNTVLYGHCMKSGKMFGKLANFASQRYFDAHPVFFLYTPSGAYCVELFAAYTTRSDSFAYTFVFDDDASFLSFLEEARACSAVENDVMPNAHDRILTLSTCAYAFAGARFVLQGRLIPLDGSA